MSARALYLSYDGLTDPLGQSQVLPYLKGLAAKGHRITVISCEKPDAMSARGEAVAADCAVSGIAWQPLPYTKSPPVLSTLADLKRMRKRAVALHRANPFDLVHCRSYLTGLIGRYMQRRFGTRFLFDMRGFWIDERFERGIWNERNPAYGIIAAWLRMRERDLFSSADVIVSLTHAAKTELHRRGGDAWSEKTVIIPCCVDLDLFEPQGCKARLAGRELLGISQDVQVMVHVGSVHENYPLEAIAEFWAKWRGSDENSLLLFLTRDDPSSIFEHPAISKIKENVLVRSGERQSMPALIAAADAGVALTRHSLSALASSPVKVGEMLAMGVPVAASSAFGDMNHILGEKGGGMLVPDLSSKCLASTASAFRGMKRDPAVARAVALTSYSLGSGIDAYERAYCAMLEK